jgi:hypothetical protein
MNQNGWSSSFAMRLLPLGTRPTAIQIPWMEGKLKYRLLFASVLLVRGIQLKWSNQSVSVIRPEDSENSRDIFGYLCEKNNQFSFASSQRALALWLKHILKYKVGIQVWMRILFETTLVFIEDGF